MKKRKIGLIGLSATLIAATSLGLAVYSTRSAEPENQSQIIGSSASLKVDDNAKIPHVSDAVTNDTFNCFTRDILELRSDKNLIVSLVKKNFDIAINSASLENLNSKISFTSFRTGNLVHETTLKKKYDYYVDDFVNYVSNGHLQLSDSTLSTYLFNYVGVSKNFFDNETKKYQSVFNVNHSLTSWASYNYSGFYAPANSRMTAAKILDNVLKVTVNSAVITAVSWTAAAAYWAASWFFGISIPWALACTTVAVTYTAQTVIYSALYFAAKDIFKLAYVSPDAVNMDLNSIKSLFNFMDYVSLINDFEKILKSMKILKAVNLACGWADAIVTIVFMYLENLLNFSSQIDALKTW